MKKILLATAITLCASSVMAASQDVRQEHRATEYGGLAVGSSIDPSYIIKNHGPRMKPETKFKGPILKARFGNLTTFSSEGERALEFPRKSEGKKVQKAVSSLKSKETKKSSCYQPKSYTVHFPFNSAELDPSESKKLIDFLRAVDKQKYEINVAGYTCDIGGQQSNDKLAKKRAKAVESVLTNNNFKIGKVTGLGKKDFLTKAAKQKMLNRRVEITLSEIKEKKDK